jgi:hypothetical protein
MDKAEQKSKGVKFSELSEVQDKHGTIKSFGGGRASKSGVGSLRKGSGKGSGSFLGSGRGAWAVIPQKTVLHSQKQQK